MPRRQILLTNHDHIETIALVDPRNLDGNPYEVAEQAVAQAEALARLALKYLDSSYKMARNASLERSLVLTGEVPKQAYKDSAECMVFNVVLSDLTRAVLKLEALKKAVAYDPKARTTRAKAPETDR